MARPRIAIVGRQNVGKSTLVNRIVGERVTIAHDMPGVTRDRVEVVGSWRDHRFGLTDTAGFVAKATGLEAQGLEHADIAVADADVILLVVDVHSGVTEEDARLARRLRRATAPVLVVANKADSPADTADVTAFHALGLGAPFAVSALHGQGVGDLLDAAVDLLPEGEEDAGIEERRVAIVGRPNVGKSSLFNRLIGEERSIVSEVSGTTRDAVDSVVEWPEIGPIRFVDTAGMRRGQRVRGIEYYSFLRAAAAIDAAHVVVLVIDAEDGFTVEDKKIASRVIEAGRALVLVANKWDRVEDRDRAFRALQDETRLFARAQALRTSATSGQGVTRLPSIIADLHGKWTSRAATSTVNDIVRDAQRERPTDRRTGTLHYATQVATGPPTVVIFGGANPPGPGYRRFLENRLRRELGLEGVPIRLRFRPRGSGRPRPG
ncbi:MAG TPA: ribosome biogenesis GTPase Der [Actinomycetota bacterium]|nr:ribosome biogenesis GTPase Der [Actinomycetota bacterium]